MSDDYDDAIKDFKIAKVELAGAWHRLLISLLSLIFNLSGIVILLYGLFAQNLYIEIVGGLICILSYIDYKFKQLEG